MPDTSRRKPLVYLGCALTHAPGEFLEDISYLRQAISPYVEWLTFLGLNHPSLSDAFQYDLNCVRRCDLLIANMTYPSLGLGMEYGVAVETRKPIISLADDHLAAPRLLAWGYWDPLHFKLRYETREEAATFCINTIHKLFGGVAPGR